MRRVEKQSAVQLAEFGQFLPFWRVYVWGLAVACVEDKSSLKILSSGVPGFIEECC